MGAKLRLIYTENMIFSSFIKRGGEGGSMGLLWLILIFSFIFGARKCWKITLCSTDCVRKESQLEKMEQLLPFRAAC